MKPILGLLALAAVAGGIAYAVKSKAEEAAESAVHEVTGDSGTNYHSEIMGTREVEGRTVVIVNVYTTSHELILVYQQYTDDPNSRIWDKLAGGMPPDTELWNLAVQDFGVFTSV